MRRVGRLIGDYETDLSEVVEAVNEHTRFTMEEAHPMRLDLYEDSGEEDLV